MKALIIPDCHIPAHNVRAYALMLKVAKDFKPDEIVILGDFGDFYAVSAHGGKHPESEGILKKEVRAVRDKLRELEKLFPKAKKVFIEGNHEYRLGRYINDKAPELFGLVDVPSLLGLEKWEFVPYSPDQLYAVGGSKLYARHEPYSGGVHAAHGTVAKGLVSMVFGHTHRKDESHIVSAGQKNFRGFCPGWLGNKKRHEFDYVKGHYQWTTGFALVETLKNGNFFHQLVDIVDSKCYAMGKFYEQNN